ncbi:MAG: CAP domain-containing protein [Actinomycetota bacterium]
MDKTHRPHRASWLVVLVTLSVSLLSAWPAGASGSSLSGDESAVAWRINHERYIRKIHTLTISDSVSQKAREHSCQMAKDQALSESSRPGTDYVDEDWTVAGENVGMDSDLYSLHLAWMDSPEHRDNILDWQFDRMGVGVCKDDSGTYWATVIFWGVSHS